jgi:hypothetical protein
MQTSEDEGFTTPKTHFPGYIPSILPLLPFTSVVFKMVQISVLFILSSLILAVAAARKFPK